MKHKIKLLLTYVILLSFFIPFTANAGKVDLTPLVSVESEESFGKHKIRIEPMITVGLRMDSNFYKADEDEKTVYTYNLRPGIRFGYETAKSSLFLSYRLDATYYDGDSDDYTGHTAALSARTKPFARLSLGLEDSFFRTRDPGSSDRFSNSVSREKYFINRLTPSVIYEFGEKFSLGLRYRNTFTEYDDSDSEGSVENRGILDLIYNFNPRTHLDLQYSRWKRDYDRNTSDYTSDQFNIILAKQLKRLTVEIGAGYHKRRFSESELDDISTFSYKVAALWQNEDRSRFRFTAERNFNDAGTGNAYFRENRFTLSAARTFRERLTASLSASYGISDYETSSRKDDKYNISAKLGYMLNQWLSLNIEAGYEARDSNLAGYDYENKYIMGNLGFRYDPGAM